MKGRKIKIIVMIEKESSLFQFYYPNTMFEILLYSYSTYLWTTITTTNLRRLNVPQKLD
jgi:hypothetical protein